MNIKKCPLCGSLSIKKNGSVHKIKKFSCKDCDRQFIIKKNKNFFHGFILTHIKYRKLDRLIHHTQKKYLEVGLPNIAYGAFLVYIDI